MFNPLSAGSGNKRGWLILVWTLACCLHAQAETESGFLAEEKALLPTTEESPKIIEDRDILALNENMRRMADIFVMPARTSQHKVKAIGDLMYAADKFALRYDGSQTKTAAETVTSGSGNCISLANTFIALARYAGLKAEYLSVRMPPNWEETDDFYFLMRHMSAYIRVHGDIEYTVDFQMVSPRQYKDKYKKRLKDQLAFAEFYNNLAAESLVNGDKKTALVYFNKSIAADPKYAPAYTNLGILYSSLQQTTEAEKAYRSALEIKRLNPTALNNLATLYMQQGRTEEAREYFGIIEHYRLRNPYYLKRLAKQSIKDGDWKQATKFLKKATRIKPEEDEFHFQLAIAYYLAGDRENAIASMQKARGLAAMPEDQNRYAQKLRLLTAARGQ
jgi:Flp pilus assembly protein TadD